MADQTVTFDILARDRASKVFKNVGRSSEGLGSKLAGLAKFAAKSTAVVVAAGLGTALAKGWGRLTQIEDAEAKLRGLGHTGETIKTTMDNALAAVKGTAFGLGDAATVAASAIASGIKPGRDLERYLRLVADAAAISGTSLGEMGEIMNTSTASQRVMAEDLNQMTARGIPALQWLADEYGVTAGELRSMVSAGKVDAETFRRVMEKNVTGSALEMGKTTKGAFANLGAAVSRFGAGLLSGVFPKIRGAFSGLTDLLDKFTPTAQKWGETISQSVTRSLERLSDWWDRNGPKIIATAKDLFEQRLIPAFKAVASFVIGTFVPALVKIGQWVVENKPVLIGIATAIAVSLIAAFIGWATAATAAAVATLVAVAPVLIVGAAIAALTAGLVWAYQNVDIFRTAVDAVASFLVGTVWPIIKESARIFTDVVIPAIVKVVEWWWNFHAAVFEVVGAVIGKVVEIATAVGEKVGEIIGFIGDVIGKFVEWATKAGEIATDIMSKLDTVVTFVTGLPERIAEAATGMWDGIKDAFKAAINWIIDAWNGLEFKIPGFNPPGPGPKFGGFTLGMPDIPRLHDGGIFRSVQREGLALLRDREGVFTPEQMAAMGGGGIHDNVIHLHYPRPEATEGVGRALRKLAITLGA